MKKEWKWLMVTEEDIANGLPDDCVNCPVALALGRAIEEDGNFKDYRPHVGGDDMFLKHRTDDELPIAIEIFKGEEQVYKDFIWEFDMTDAPDAPIPGTIGFRYRIIDKKEAK